MKENGNGRLVSWKEIAAYLGVDVRTCLRWEKERGLPVHRPGGKPGPRVMAWEKELDDWLAGAAKSGDGGPTGAPEDAAKAGAATGPGSGRIRKGHWLAASALAAAALGLIGYGFLSRDRVPADFRIDGSKLIILNKAKQDLWAFDTQIKDLPSEADYRKTFQRRRWDDALDFSYPSSLIIDDLDADGRVEVLFTPHSDKSPYNRKLYCFDHRGQRKWAEPFEGGREMVFGKKPFSRDYTTSFEAADIDGDGRREIIVFSDQIPDWPTQLTILGSDGRRRGEYWNCGRFLDMAITDLNGDGHLEILLGGVHNESRRAFLAVLDPAAVSGMSPILGTMPESAQYRNAALAAGSENAYILFPPSDIDPYGSIMTILSKIEVIGNGRIRGMIARTNLLYDLDPRTLACMDITFSNLFKQRRDEAIRIGKARGSLDEAYARNLKNGFLYWTGRGWTSTPTWARPLGR
jgi:hypothetical protein